MAVEALWRDFRLALRHHRARPVAALFSVAVLALGIGGTIATVALVRGILLRPLPFPDAEHLVSVGRSPREARGAPILTVGELQRLREAARTFEDVGAWVPRGVVLRNVEGAEAVAGAAATPSLFRLLQLSPHIGRLFQEADAAEGAQAVAMVSYGTWTGRFASDPGLVGSSVELSGEPHVVVGVLPQGFVVAEPRAEIWTSLRLRSPEGDPGGGMVVRSALAGIGRLQAWASPQAAVAEVETILRRPGREDRPPGVRDEQPLRVAGLRGERNRTYRPALVTLAAAAVALLLMACANAGGLLLSQGIGRMRQMAIRAALGASRGQIARQLLMESATLGVVAGGLAVGVSEGGLRLAPLVVPVTVPGLAEATIDGFAVAAGGALSVVAAGLAGVVPAVVVSRGDVSRSLDDGAATIQGGFGRLRVNRAHAMLATVQVALAVVLLSCGALLLRSFVALVGGDLGFDPAKVLATRIETPAVSQAFTRVGGQIGLEELQSMGAANRRTLGGLVSQLDRFRSLPGVQAAAIASTMPLQPASAVRTVVAMGGSTGAEPEGRHQVGVRHVTGGYADVVRLRLRRGRFLDDRDLRSGARVAVVSESFARMAFDGESALGRRLRQQGSPGSSFSGGQRSDGPSWEIVGIVADVESPLGRGLFEQAPAGEIYLPFYQQVSDPATVFMQPTIVTRTVGEPSRVTPFLHEALAETHPRSAIRTTSLATALSLRAAQPRFYAACAGTLGAVALLLASTSLYGVLSFLVAHRRREIGLRIALGATPYDVVRLVAAQGGALVLGGSVIGVIGATASTDVIASIVVGVGDTDVLTLAAVVALLGVVGLVACWRPARQAALVDPMVAMRDR